MAKDPAFLFYPGDWQVGTSTMTRHEKGCYIDLLTTQFNSGPLTLKDIKTVLGNDFAAWQGSLSKKFSVDKDGLYFNERLEKEKRKRKEYSDMQTEKVKKRWEKHNSHTDEHTAVSTYNENENTVLDVKAVKNKKEMLTDQLFHEDACKAFSISLPFMLGKLNQFIALKAPGGELEKPLSRCKSHFMNWLRIELEKNPPKEKKLYTQTMHL